MDAIKERRSIRRFSDRPIQREALLRVLQAGVEAPSAKNRQPWRFVVVTGDAREGMAQAMLDGIGNIEASMPDMAEFLKWARVTARVMRQAPATVLMLDPGQKGFPLPRAVTEQMFLLANTQSQGAALENMCLAAMGEGLGSLWINDVFFAYDELRAWLKTDEQLVSAMSLGYPLESPGRRPRKALADILEWRE